MRRLGLRGRCDHSKTSCSGLASMLQHGLKPHLEKKRGTPSARDVSLTSEKSWEIMRNHPWDFRSRALRALKNWTLFCSKLMIPRWPGNSLRSKDAWATKCEPQEPKSPKAIRREKSELGTLRLGMSWEMQDANSHKFTWSYMGTTLVLHGHYMGTTCKISSLNQIWDLFHRFPRPHGSPPNHRSFATANAVRPREVFCWGSTSSAGRMETFG